VTEYRRTGAGFIPPTRRDADGNKRRGVTAEKSDMKRTPKGGLLKEREVFRGRKWETTGRKKWILHRGTYDGLKTHLWPLKGEGKNILSKTQRAVFIGRKGIFKSSERATQRTKALARAAKRPTKVREKSWLKLCGRSGVVHRCTEKEKTSAKGSEGRPEWRGRGKRKTSKIQKKKTATSRGLPGFWRLIERTGNIHFREGMEPDRSKP